MSEPLIKVDAILTNVAPMPAHRVPAHLTERAVDRCIAGSRLGPRIAGGRIEDAHIDGRSALLALLYPGLDQGGVLLKRWPEASLKVLDVMCDMALDDWLRSGPKIDTADTPAIIEAMSRVVVNTLASALEVAILGKCDAQTECLVPILGPGVASIRWAPSSRPPVDGTMDIVVLWVDGVQTRTAEPIGSGISVETARALMRDPR